jgi:predicted  nucleic acid-binding Zn-ribbon protein
MAHECDDCGKSFDTLTRLRLHDCGDIQSETSSTSSEPNRSDSGYSSPTEERNASVAELDTLLDRFLDDDKDALQYAVVDFESAVSAALEEDNSGDTYRDVCWPYHERVSDALDEAARSAGWTFLENVIDTHDPTEDDEISLVSYPRLKSWAFSREGFRPTLRPPLRAGCTTAGRAHGGGSCVGFRPVACVRGHLTPR